MRGKPRFNLYLYYFNNANAGVCKDVAKQINTLP